MKKNSVQVTQHWFLTLHLHLHTLIIRGAVECVEHIHRTWIFHAMQYVPKKGKRKKEIHAPKTLSSQELHAWFFWTSPLWLFHLVMLLSTSSGGKLNIVLKEKKRKKTKSVFLFFFCLVWRQSALPLKKACAIKVIWCIRLCPPIHLHRTNFDSKFHWVHFM